MRMALRTAVATVGTGRKCHPGPAKTDSPYLNPFFRPAGDSAQLIASKMAQAARAGAEATRSMVAQAGRSSYVPAEALASVPDPGAVGVATWMEAVAAALA